MRKLRSVIAGLSFSIFLFSILLLAIGEDATASGGGTAEAAPGDEASWPAQTVSLSEALPASEAVVSTGIQVTLSAVHWTRSWDVRDPERPRFDLPLLYLHHEREATAGADRTLALSIVGLAGGTEIEVEVISRHEDISTGDRRSETRSFLLPGHPCTSADPCTVQWTFDPSTTLSDFYSLCVKDSIGHTLWENPYSDRPDLVMLDTWDTYLDGYTLRVTYATLFPFARGQTELANRLPPDAVTDFIERQFVPIIVDTWNSQFHAWGFDSSIHPNWDSDKVVEIIVTDPPFALFDDLGTYSRFIGRDGQPTLEARIWWFSSNNSFLAYDSLEDSYRVVFAHEFFHLMQRNVLLSTGRPRNRWRSVFIEGQGKFAPSAQHFAIEMNVHHVRRKYSEYSEAANRFLSLRLNASYRDLEADPINRYDAALYWRFLYEQFGGMGVIRAALEEMAVRYDPDIVAAIGPTMDSAFARFDGPFSTFEESLIGFARANYALRLENGRCKIESFTECRGYYYDPNDSYVNPPLEAEIGYNGSLLTYDAAIPASFGMDFVEVRLGSTARDQPILISFQGEGAVARFNVQVWKLEGGSITRRAITPHPEIAPQDQNGAQLYVVSDPSTTVYNKLAIIITRLDADETTDPAGNYRITLEPATDTL